MSVLRLHLAASFVCSSVSSVLGSGVYWHVGSSGNSKLAPGDARRGTDIRNYDKQTELQSTEKSSLMESTAEELNEQQKVVGKAMADLATGSVASGKIIGESLPLHRRWLSCGG